MDATKNYEDKEFDLKIERILENWEVISETTETISLIRTLMFVPFLQTSKLSNFRLHQFGGFHNLWDTLVSTLLFSTIFYYTINQNLH